MHIMKERKNIKEIKEYTQFQGMINLTKKMARAAPDQHLTLKLKG